MPYLTEAAARRKFAQYFLDLQAAMAAEVARVSKSAEWERFREKLIEDDQAPAEAANWKCPRSLQADLLRP